MIDQLNKLTDEELRARVALALGMCAHPIEAWEREGTEGDMELVCNKCGKALRDARIPNYPADLNAAFTLVEKLHAEGWCIVLQWFWATWQCRFYHDGTPPRKKVDAFDPSLARAICLAFLAVTEREEG